MITEKHQEEREFTQLLYIAIGPERGIISKRRSEFNQKCHRCQLMYAHTPDHTNKPPRLIKGGHASGWAAKMTPLRAGLERNFRNEPPMGASGENAAYGQKRKGRH